MTYTMRDYQLEYIYTPMMNVMNKRIELAKANVMPKDTPKVLQLSTSAGKTFTTCNFVIPDIVDMGCDVIYTIPNAASVHEVSEMLQERLPNHLVWGESAVFGQEFQMPYLDDNQQMVVVVYPTVLSQNAEYFAQISKTRKFVIISDESHKGLSCPDAESTRLAFGGYDSSYEANWFEAISDISYVAWFMISATPLRPVYKLNDTYEVISSFMSRDILYETHKSVKKVVLYKSDLSKFSVKNCQEANSIVSNSGYMKTSKDELILTRKGYKSLNASLVAKIKEDDAWLAQVTAEYDLPKAKPARIIQTDNDKAHHVFHSLGKDGIKTAITTTDDKKVYGYAKPNYLRDFKQSYPNSAQLISFVGNSNNKFTTLVANKIVGEAVNLRNATLLVSDHTRSSKNDLELTSSIEQLLGRMLRWPDVDGIYNWCDAIDYRELRISQGVPRYVMEKWIDMVFSYEVHMSFSPINVSGIETFFSLHTYNPVEWIEAIKSHDIMSRAKYGTRVYSEKMPWAQEGSQEYKKYRDENPQCEICPKNAQGIPVCEAAYEGRVTKETIYESNEVHHIDGNHENNDPSNLVTVCHVAHYDISVKEKHFHNKKYRSEAA